MGTLINDIRYGVRSLLKQPGFTFITVVTLTLGIGANTAIFSVVNGVLLRPLPFKDSDRLMMVWNKGAAAAGGDRTPLCVADLLDWRAQNRSFESIGAFQKLLPINYSSGETPEQLHGASVTVNFLSVLGVQVQLGRDFQAGDEQLGAPRVVLLSDHFWRSHFGADRQVVGRTIKLNGLDNLVVGIMPDKLNFPAEDVEVWIALQVGQPTRRGPYFLTGVARLKPGISRQQARVDTQGITSSFDRQHFNFNLVSIDDYVVGDVRLTLEALLAAATLVLLIAAVNVANLTLVRAAAKSKEISIRTALGASRWRIGRRLMTESLLLALAGGVLGTLCALWTVDLLVKSAPETLPRINEIKVEPLVLGWTALVSILTCLVFGLAPAWHSTRLNLNEALRDGGRGSTESAGRRRWRGALVVTEMALAVMLLISAGLVMKSLWRLQHVDTGIDPERVFTMQVALVGQRYRELQPIRSFYSRLLQETRALPGIRTVAISSCLPPDDSDFSSDFTIEGLPPQEAQIAYFTKVSPDYFQTLGISLRAGRFFNHSGGGSGRLAARAKK